MLQRTKCRHSALLFAVSICSAQTQTSDPTHVTDFPQFRVIQGKINSNGLPTSGARLCLLKPANLCYEMTSNTGYSSGKVVYDYGLDPRSERLSLKGGGSFVFFSARFSGGGSGTLDSLAILRYENAKEIVNLLPFVGVSEQSDRAIWGVPEASNLPILVTADFDWMKGETHFSKHFYNVTAYCLDARADRYAKAFSYRTSRKYPSLDEVDHVHVLKPEREEILRRLESSSSCGTLVR
jgi:hypothetical protein